MFSHTISVAAPAGVLACAHFAMRPLRILIRPCGHSSMTNDLTVGLIAGNAVVIDIAA
jgi:hypothetical protein